MSGPVRLPLRMEFVERHETDVADVYEVCDADGEVLLSDQTYYPTAPTREVAEWIVAVANSHRELLAAAKEALGGMSGGTDNGMCHSGLTTRERCVQCQRVDSLRAAIAKAEGRS